MYKVNVPFKDLYDKPHTETVHLNLYETEVFKLMREFQLVLNWRESIQSEDLRQLDTGEVIEFYTALEEILLSAFGHPSADGMHFDKSGRYKYQDSPLHNATMLLFITDPAKATEMVDGLMPKGLEDLVLKADENLAALAKKEGTDVDMRRQIDELRLQLAEKEAAAGKNPPAVSS